MKVGDNRPYRLPSDNFSLNDAPTISAVASDIEATPTTRENDVNFKEREEKIKEFTEMNEKLKEMKEKLKRELLKNEQPGLMMKVAPQ